MLKNKFIKTASINKKMKNVSVVSIDMVGIIKQLIEKTKHKRNEITFTFGDMDELKKLLMSDNETFVKMKLSEYVDDSEIGTEPINKNFDEISTLCCFFSEAEKIIKFEIYNVEKMLYSQKEKKETKRKEINKEKKNKEKQEKVTPQKTNKNNVDSNKINKLVSSCEKTNKTNLDSKKPITKPIQPIKPIVKPTNKQLKTNSVPIDKPIKPINKSENVDKPITKPLVANSNKIGNVDKPQDSVPKSKFYYTESDGYEYSESVMRANQQMKRQSELKDSKNWENVKIDKWTASQFLQYMSHKFQQVYNFSSLEFEVVNGKKYQPTAVGLLYTKIKRNLIGVFAEHNLDKTDLKDYVDWCYDFKSSQVDFPITLNFLSSKAMMTEFIRNKIKKNKKKTNHSVNGVNKKIHKPE